MAQGKKAVVIYADWIDKFEELTDEEAGRLIKHFFRYVNDLNPVAPDRITKLSFLDIEKSLKRDLKKWEERAERSRINGSKGGRRTNLEEPEKTQQVISEPEKPDTVNGKLLIVNDTVNVLSKDNLIKKTKILEFVELSEKEIESLKMKYGDECYYYCIEKLNSYKGSSGKKYKSDYHAITTWVLDKFNEQKTKHANSKTTESLTDYLKRVNGNKFGNNNS